MDGNYWVEDTGLLSPPASKVRKRRVGKRKFEFIGWGSKPLIEFLESVGKDTSEKPTQREVAAFITKYVNEKGLVSAEKKKKVFCDDRLHALFGKKSVSRPKVYDMLEEHFAENHDDSEDEFYSSEEEGGNKSTSLLLKKNPSGQIKKVHKTPKSCFAAVISENIKLVYLKRSLIQDLLKVHESFEFKVVGSFVRMKSDPNDIYQKNRFQLQQVTGVEKVPGAGDAGIEILLRVSNFFKEVPISMLSDDNFSEEEVEDVRDRIKSGLLKRLTVKAVEEKAQILHADITNHWIPREIILLQHKIDHANEKGRRREMFEYLDRKKMLQTPSEQEKLLLKTPDVIAEEIEPEVTAATATSEKEEGSGGSPKSILRASSDVSSTEVLGSGGIVAPSQVILSDLNVSEHSSESIDAALSLNGSGGIVAPSQVILCDLNASEHPSESIDAALPLNGSGGIVAPSQVILCDLNASEHSSESIDAALPLNGSGGIVATSQVILCDLNASEHPSESIDAALPLNGCKPDNNEQFPLIADGGIKATEAVVVSEGTDKPTEKPGQQQASTAIVIDLSDDESEDEVLTVSGQISVSECPNEVIWHYTDPQGQPRGPFPLYLMKRWSDASYFHSGFRVWKSSQNPCEGVLLIDLLRRCFQN